MGDGGLRARARALHRRADGRRDRFRLRARGRQTPRNGHCESACARLNPQAFIIPRWQSEKSYLTGSSGSSRRSDAVMSRAIAPPRAGVGRQPQAPADADDVGVERHDQLCRRHARPHARGRARRAAPSTAETGSAACMPDARRRPRKEVADARAATRARGRRRRREVERHRPAPAEKLSSAGATSSADRIVASRKNPSIDPARSIICRSSQRSATRSGPRVQRCTMPANAAPSRSGSKRRT